MGRAKVFFVGVQRCDLTAYVLIEDFDKDLGSFSDQYLFVYGPFEVYTNAQHWRDLYNLPDGEVIVDGG